MRAIDRTGQRYGRLTAIKRDGHKGKNILWRCECDCGGEALCTASNLQTGTSQSCGCLNSELCSERAIKRNTVHGQNTVAKKTGAWISWNCMRTRCEQKSHISYPDYGGRGIKVCDRWYKFENFYADMGDRPKDKSIDRIDNDGDYEPSNCRWATRSEQQRNRRNTKINELDVINIRKSTLPQRQIAEHYGVSLTLINQIKLNKAWV